MYISSGNNETILHYAARHNNPEVARYACDPKHWIKINQRDLFGAYAPDYIRDDEIGVKFKKHEFFLNYNYKTKCYEPEITTNRKELRGKFISLATTITDESNSGPTEFKRPRIATDAVSQLNLQPGPSRFK